MAGERALPGLGLFGFWTPGSNGWGDQNDTNLRTLSAVAQCSVLSDSTPLGAGSQGDVTIVPAGAVSNANDIAVFDDGAWEYITPVEGAVAYVQDENTLKVWDGSVWAAGAARVNNITANATLTLADAGSYVRVDSASAVNITVPADSAVGLPVGAQIAIRQAGTGTVAVVADTGVTVTTPATLNLRGQHATVTLVKAGADLWDLTGDLEAAP